MPPHWAWPRDDITLCHTPATEKFALFASNKNFNNEHQMPRAYIHVSEADGKMITYDYADGVKANAWLKNLNSDVLNIWATKDQWINKEVMDKFEANMKAAGKKLTVYSYDADHGFTNPSNAIYDEVAYKDSRVKTIEYFKTKMR